jgi:hypothetical protein
VEPVPDAAKPVESGIRNRLKDREDKGAAAAAKNPKKK